MTEVCFKTKNEQTLSFILLGLHVRQYLMICHLIVNELPVCPIACISIATTGHCKAVAVEGGGGKQNEH